MKYAKAHEIVTLVLADRRSKGERYRPDVVEMAARVAADAHSDHEAINAIENAFYSARISINPKWDGSIA